MKKGKKVTQSTLINPVSRRGFVIGAMGTAVLAPLLAACSAAPSPTQSASGKVDVSVWTNDKNYPAFFAKRAKSLSSHGKYNYTVTDVVSSDIWTKAVAAFAAKSTVPSMLGIDISHFSQFMVNNIAEDIFVDLTGKMGAPDSAFLDSRLKPYEIGGRVYGMESATTIVTTYKRDDLWEKYKIPHADTWDDYLKIGAEQFSRNGIHLGMADATSSDVFQNLLFQRGGRVFDSDGKSVIDSREALDCLQLMYDAVRNGTFALTDDYWGGPGIGLMKSNKVAAIWSADWFNPFYLVPNLPEQKGKWSIQNPPVFSAGGYRTSVYGGTGFAVTKDRPETAATLALLQDAYGTVDGQVDRFKTLGYLPTLKAVWDRPDVVSHTDPYLGGQKVMDVYKPLSANLPIQRQDVRYQEFLAAADGAVSLMFANKQSPTQALKQIAAKLKGNA
jgi:arabinosaccharide transport system substrate-binding protein